MTTRSPLASSNFEAEQGDEAARQIRHLHGSPSSINGAASLAAAPRGKPGTGRCRLMGENR